MKKIFFIYLLNFNYTIYYMLKRRKEKYFLWTSVIFPFAYYMH